MHNKRSPRQNKSSTIVQDNYGNLLKWYCHVMKMKDEHSVRRMPDTDVQEKKKRVVKRKVEICLQERYDNGGSERGQHNKKRIVD